MVWTFLISIAIGGGIFYFSLLYLNSRLAEKQVVTEDFKIIKTGNLARGRKRRCGQPYAIIYFNEIEKELIFFCKYDKDVKAALKVRLKYSNGLFGFAVIKTKQLVK